MVDSRTPGKFFFLDSKAEWFPPWWASERVAHAFAYPDTTPPNDDSIVFCIPVMRRKRNKALQPAEFNPNVEIVLGVILLPIPGEQGAYRRRGCFDNLPECQPKLDFGEEYCYRRENKKWFSDGPAGSSETILLA